MAFWRRIWQRDSAEALAACTALDVGTEFAKALVFDIDAEGHGTVRGVGRKRQGLSHMQSGTVADIAAVVDNCAVALQEAEEMAGFRPTQVVIGIAGELVKGFTTTHSQERKKPDQPITDGELQKLIDVVQREALHEAERAITWETGLPHVDVRLVHAAVTGASIDGYALTNPVGFQGRHVKIGIFNAFAPLVHLGALQSVASQLDLELLEIVAEPYAVARVLGSDQIRQAGALFVDVGGGTTDVALVRQGGIEGTRMFALGGRAFTKSIADRLDLPFPRAESLKVDYARGLAVNGRAEVAEIVRDDAAVWAAGVELVMEELAAGEMLVLRGANGSGKSTLLRVMAGLTPVLSGEIRWGDGAIQADRIAHNSRCHYVSHQDALKPVLTVRQNLELWQSLRNGGPERIELALERLGIARLADLPALLLSAGQRRRLALARLMAMTSPLWLLDEPATALDADGAARLEQILRDHLAGGGR
jgi:cell division protein FtsA